MTSSITRALAPLAAVALLASGCGGGVIGGDGESADSPGVTDDSITLAETDSLTGNFAAVTGPYVASAKMVFKNTNDDGGINDRTVEWDPVDDGGDIQRAVTQAQKFTQSDDVFAAVLPLGTAATIAKAEVYGPGGLPYINLGTSTAVTAEGSFGCSTSYYSQILAAVTYVAEDDADASFGSLVWATQDGEDVSGGAADALADQGRELKAKVTFEPGTTDFTAQLNTLKNAGVDYVVAYGSTPDSARLVQAAARADLDVSFIFPEPALDAAFLDLTEGRADGTLIASPFYSIDSGEPGVEDYIAELKDYDPDVKPSFWGMFGYHCAKVIVEALEQAGDDPTRESFIDALGQVSEFDSGVHAPVTLNEGEPARGGTLLYRVTDGAYQLESDGFIADQAD